MEIKMTRKALVPCYRKTLRNVVRFIKERKAGIGATIPTTKKYDRSGYGLRLVDFDVFRYVRTYERGDLLKEKRLNARAHLMSIS